MYSDSSYSDSDSDPNSLYVCPYCPNSMPERSLDRHIQRKHKLCQFCQSRMSEEDFKQHIQLHYTTCQNCSARILKWNVGEHRQQCEVICKYCDLRIPTASMGAHIEANHRRLFGITVPELNDHECNRLIAANKLYVHNGRVYIK